MDTPAVPDTLPHTAAPELESPLVTNFALATAGILLLGCSLVVVGSIMGWLKAPAGATQAPRAFIGVDIEVLLSLPSEKSEKPH